MGVHRGGLGQRKTVRALHPLTAVLLIDRFEHPAGGILGGGAGRAAGAYLADGRPISAKSELSLASGDVLSIESPGGGGFGDPLERPRETVLRDIEEGYVTAWPKVGDATGLN